MHQVFNMDQQTPAERAAGVGAREVFGAKVSRLENGDRQGIAHGQCGSCAGGRREIMGTGLALNADIKTDICRHCDG